MTEEVDFDEGTVLMSEGERGSEVFVVVRGRLDVSRRGDGNLATVDAGQVVGEIALLSNQPRSATVTAATAVHVLRIGGTDFVEPARADAAPVAQDHARAGRPDRERRAPAAVLRGLTRR